MPENLLEPRELRAVRRRDGERGGDLVAIALPDIALQLPLEPEKGIEHVSTATDEVECGVLAELLDGECAVLAPERDQFLIHDRRQLLLVTEFRAERAHHISIFSYFE